MCSFRVQQTEKAVSSAAQKANEVSSVFNKTIVSSLPYFCFLGSIGCRESKVGHRGGL
jgi:hypothetical protein